MHQINSNTPTPANNHAKLTLAMDDAPTNKWKGKIPKAMEEFVGNKCPNGSFIQCNVCLVWDEDPKSNFGHVKLRNNFWVAYFGDHIKSARHKRNCMRKACHDEGNKRRLERGKKAKKRMKQSLLPFATKKPTPTQVRARIIGGVCPTLAPGDPKEQEDEDIIAYFEAEKSIQEKEVTNCQGILAKKDLTDKTVQQGINLSLKYCSLLSSKKDDYKVGNIMGNELIKSVFCNECTGSSESVR